jgi:hypothetical protein
MTTTIMLDICTPEGKTWLAEVTGTGGKFGIERDFVSAVSKNTSRSGMTGTATYIVDNGVYESNEGRLGRRYWIVENDEKREVERDDALAWLKRGAESK